MSVYNGARHLSEAVASVLHQTFEDFEFVIVNDGSTDGTRFYLLSIPDPRVRIVQNPTNEGLAASLNRGLDRARGQFIARMDADDVAAPERLERQVAFMRRNPTVGVAGTGRLLIDEQGKSIAMARPTVGNLAIRWKSLLGNPFAHPTVMMRREVLGAHRLRYDESYRTAQDYELWTRLLPLTRAANLDEPLLYYRLRPDRTSESRRTEQLANHDRIAAAAIRRFAPTFDPTPDTVYHLRGRFGGFSVREPNLDPTDPIWLGRRLQLLDAFCSTHRDQPGYDAFARAQRASILQPPQRTAAAA
jgi:glycosyltransferase involved in cell wall biosynthesis